MVRVPRVSVIDCYVDEPACLGVPPYISPQVRAAAGAARRAGAEAVYLTIDHVRRGHPLPPSDVALVMAGSAVPGKYLRAMPASPKEVQALARSLPGIKMLGGPAAREAAMVEGFDHAVHTDPAAALHDLLGGQDVTGRWRALDEWNSWLLAGADIVMSHPDHPHPLVAEVEAYRGCVRYRSGGCSFCVEPLKGPPLFRNEEDIIEECARLRSLGVTNVRVGGQTCIVSYRSDVSSGDLPRPNPGAVERLFAGLSAQRWDVLHVDNANPAVIAAYPKEGREVLRSLVRHCTSGNVLALGLESADPVVARANNLNASAEQALEAIRMINQEGREVGSSGLPYLLPGLNFIVGLDHESTESLELDRALLRQIASEGLLLRRINVRQVIPSRRPFRSTVGHHEFVRFKTFVREEIDRPMLEALVPRGTVLRRVFMELRDGHTTFGRQAGSYPLLVGVPYPVELDRYIDVTVTGWGYRSVTGIEMPLHINHCSLKALEALPGVGRKRAIRLFRHRPLVDRESLVKALDDPQVAGSLIDLVSFD